jgi:predicted permease
MLATFESILPIFLLIVAGNLLRRAPVIDEAGWTGLNQMAYWFLYPALLFITILRADFSGVALNAMMAALVLAILVMIAATALLLPLLGRLGLARRSEYSSIFQTTVRWNGFMALAVAENIFPPEGLAVVALVMAVIIVPVNMASVYVVLAYSGRPMNWGRTLATMATNPLLLASLAAIGMRTLPFGLYGPLGETLDLVGRAALGMGLVAVGAGLRPGDLLVARAALLIPVVLKLAVFPALLVALALAAGLEGPALLYLALCGAVPTAMNGYVLARELGGDAELYAAITTMQTAVSFFSLPAALAVAGQIASG